jgi:HNH endonuclease
MSEAKRRADFERFVNRTETCWLWTGAKNPAGYATFRVGRVQAGAHRWAWQWAKGAIPEGMELHHSCHVRHCVNPAHLVMMTRKQNLQNRRFDSWKGIDGRIDTTITELLTVTLTPEHSAWVRARAMETGETPDDLVARAMYRYMARWLGQWKDAAD